MGWRGAAVALALAGALASCSGDGDGDGDAASTTTGPTSSTTAAPAAPPVALGTEAEVAGEWRVKVVGTTTDGTAAIAAAHQGNQPAASGHQFVVVKVEATYIGGGAGSARQLIFQAKGPSTLYGPEAPCGIVPDPLRGEGVVSGRKIAGNVCWEVASADVPGLSMSVHTGFLDTDAVLFALY